MRDKKAKNGMKWQASLCQGGYLDVFHGFPRAVADHHRRHHFLAVIVNFPVQRHFQTYLAVREREPFADQRTRQPLTPRRRRVL